MNIPKWSDSELEKLKELALLRRLRLQITPGAVSEESGGRVLSFASNDYLGFSQDDVLKKAAAEATLKSGTSAAASRLLAGNLPEHESLERALARFFGVPSALSFSSGYLCNLGVITALVGRNDWVIADKLVHATLIDGTQLSRATLKRFRHNDVQHLESLLQGVPAESRALVVTESVFSMDGDIAPLFEIAQLVRKYDALLLVDEAHAVGVYGPGGRGLVEENELWGPAVVVTATFGKALGSLGGFVLGDLSFTELLVNRARSFIYNTALPPAVAAASQAAIERLESRPELGAQLLSKAVLLRNGFQEAGFDTLSSKSQIVPIVVGDSERALKFSSALSERGVLAPAIRPPTVPQGTSRLRFSVSLSHSEEDLQFALEQVVTCGRELGVL